MLAQLLVYVERNRKMHIVMWFSLYKPVLLHRDKNCTAIWEAFQAALDKDPCSVFPSDRDLFISLSRHSVPRDKVTQTRSAWLSVFLQV